MTTVLSVQKTQVKVIFTQFFIVLDLWMTEFRHLHQRFRFYRQFYIKNMYSHVIFSKTLVSAEAFRKCRFWSCKISDLLSVGRFCSTDRWKWSILYTFHTHFYRKFIAQFKSVVICINCSLKNAVKSEKLPKTDVSNMNLLRENVDKSTFYSTTSWIRGL